MGIAVDCAKNLLRFFKDNPPTFPGNEHSRKVRVNGKLYTYDDSDSVMKMIPAEAILKYGLTDWWQADAAEKMDFFTNFLEGTFRREVIEKRLAQNELRKKMTMNGKSDLMLPDAGYILAHLMPFRVLGDTRREAGVRFFDTTTKLITDYDFFSVQSVLKSSPDVDKATAEMYLNKLLHVREVYDPFNRFSLRPIKDSNAVYEVNRHVPAPWRDVQDAKPRLDEDIDKLMRHLFPKEACRTFVYTWIYHSLTSRAGTYLYLCGGQGSGKNTLASLIAQLHGLQNVSNPKQDSLVARFNHYLKFKRFIMFDEFNCRKRADKDVLKLIINERFQIEGKGRDHEDIDNYASYFLANNSLEAIGLDPVDRRFSVPEVNNDSIVPVFGRQWVQAFSDRVKSDVRFIAEFGLWILETFKDTKVGNEEPYQSARFEEIVIATARFGIHDMLQRVFRKEQNRYTYAEEKDAFRRAYRGQHFPTIQDWTSFLRAVRKDGELVGTVESGVFTPRPEFQRSPGEEEVMS